MAIGHECEKRRDPCLREPYVVHARPGLRKDGSGAQRVQLQVAGQNRALSSGQAAEHPITERGFSRNRHGRQLSAEVPRAKGGGSEPAVQRRSGDSVDPGGERDAHGSYV